MQKSISAFFSSPKRPAADSSAREEKRAKVEYTTARSDPLAASADLPSPELRLAIEQKRAAAKAKLALKVLHPLLSFLTDESWQAALRTEFTSPYFSALTSFLDSQSNAGVKVFPPVDKTFTALNLCPVSAVRVVILGQDPYIKAGQAHGLAFSVVRGQAIPPSLQNVYTELTSDIAGFRKPSHGCLEQWAQRGVLLLNSVLTVKSGESNSHAGQGWEKFTDAVIRHINVSCKNVVFLLWGKPAQLKGKDISTSRHLILKAPHPSPKSANGGFFGCKHFSKTNAYLQQHGLPAIQWQLDP
eukprot:TRINITY_DN185_c0_g2_i2.p1 TRINITY_DN185_c0_g2~~TRINITY_DN185_c0_g2_i2.p1  ORF type:complete len:300 (+),score=47.55 TRINITY_DN185_c0_g2_i2:181-1080(+)